MNRAEGTAKILKVLTVERLGSTEDFKSAMELAEVEIDILCSQLSTRVAQIARIHCSKPDSRV
ncbi:MAG: hypothetical protein QXE79_07460 [Candidatus Bathyarchaeia archaeon]